MNGSNKSDLFKVAAPVSASVFVLIWSLSVSPFTAYGDDWALAPVFVAAAFVLGWHIFLFVRPGKFSKASIALYGFVHLCVFGYLFLLSLMWISKDSL